MPRPALQISRIAEGNIATDVSLKKISDDIFNGRQQQQSDHWPAYKRCPEWQKELQRQQQIS